MLRMTPSCQVYLAPGVTDLRNNIDGLALIVQKKMRLDPFSPSLFVFCNRKRDKLKILFWDKNGFWLYYKRLERGTFKWPERRGQQVSCQITEQQLSWLLDGFTICEKGAFPEVEQRRLI